jgi:ABC-type transport system involved in cytochrome c biogenesis permease component
MARRPGRVIVWYACVLHYAWSVLLAASPEAMHSTPVSAVVAVSGGRWGALAALVTCASAALAAPLARRGRLLPVLLVPQQTLLLMSAGAALHATAAGHYADGVPRPWPFILGDQLPVILTALLYTAALLSYRVRDER